MPVVDAVKRTHREILVTVPALSVFVLCKEMSVVRYRRICFLWLCCVRNGMELCVLETQLFVVCQL